MACEMRSGFAQTVYVCLDHVTFGCPLQDVVKIRQQSLELKDKFSEEFHKECDHFTVRGVVRLLLQTIYDQEHNATLSYNAHDPNFISFKQTYLRSKLVDSSLLTASPFVEVIGSNGEDLITVRMLLECIQVRLAKARASTKVKNEDVPAIARQYLQILFEPFIKGNFHFTVIPEHRLRLKEEFFRGSLIEQMVAIRHLAVDAETRHDCKTKIISWKVFEIALEYGKPVLLKTMAEQLAGNLAKLIRPDSGIKCPAGFRRSPRTSVVEKVKPKPGRPQLSFAQRIAPLTDLSLKPSQRKDARAVLAWGHLMECFTQRLRRKAIHNKRDWDPVGFAADGQPLAGNENLNSAIRSNIFGGEYAEFPSPLLWQQRVTSAQLEAILQSDFQCSNDMQRKASVKSSMAQAALLYKLSIFFFGKTLGVDIPLLGCMDFGSSQRQWFLFMQAEGYKVHCIWDPQHREDSDQLHILQHEVPAALSRLQAFGRAVGKTKRTQAKELSTRVLGLEDQKIIDLLSDHKQQVELRMELEMEDAEFPEAFKDAVRAMMSKVPTFTSQKRWMKVGETAEFAADNWAICDFIFHLLFKLYFPHLCGLQARQKLEQDPASPFLLHLKHDDMDLNLLTEEIKALAPEKLVGFKVPGFGNESESEDEEAQQEFVRETVDALSSLPSNKQRKETSVGRSTSPMKKRKGKAGAAVALENNVEDDQASGRKTAGNKKQTDETAVQPAKSKKQQDDENSFVYVMHMMFSNVECEMRVVIADRCIRVPMAFHNIGIAAQFINLNGFSSFFAKYPMLLSEQAMRFHAPLDKRFGNVVHHVDHGVLAAQYGKQFEISFRIFMATMRQRMSRPNRIFMCGLLPEQELSLADVRKVAPLLPNNTNSIRHVLDNPGYYLGRKDGPMAALQKPWFYNCDITDDSLDTLEKRRPEAVEMNIPAFTSFLFTGKETPAHYETRAGRRIQHVRKADTPQGKMLVRVLLGSDKYYLVEQFNLLCLQSKYKEAKELIAKWLKCMIKSTRNIEAGGGGISKAAAKANCSGLFKGNVAWYLAVKKVPMWVPYLCPVDQHGENGTGGIFVSSSILDGRQVPKDRDTLVMETENKKTPFEKMFPHGYTFEEATIGLQDPMEVIKYLDQVEGSICEDSEADLLHKAQVHFATKPRATLDDVRKSYEKLNTVDKDSHDITPDVLERFLSFNFQVSNLVHMVLAEFLADERQAFFCSKTPEAAVEWAYARAQTILLEGILQKNQRDGFPTILRCRTDGVREKFFQLHETFITLRSIYVTELNVQGDDRADTDPHPRPDEDADENFAHHVLAGSNVQTQSSSSSADVNSAPARKADSKLANFFMPRFMAKGWKARGLKLQYFEDPEAWAMPFPTSESAAGSKLRGLLLCCNRLRDLRIFGGAIPWTITVCTSARYQFGKNAEPFIYVPDVEDKSESPLHVALKQGLGVHKDFVRGKNVATAAVVKEVAKTLIKENPLRLKQLFDPKFVYARDIGVPAQERMGLVSIPEHNAPAPPPPQRSATQIAIDRIAEEAREQFKKGPLYFAERMKEQAELREKLQREKEGAAAVPPAPAPAAVPPPPAPTPNAAAVPPKATADLGNEVADFVSNVQHGVVQNDMFFPSKLAGLESSDELSKHLRIDKIDWEAWAAAAQNINFPKATMATEIMYLLVLGRKDAIELLIRRGFYRMAGPDADADAQGKYIITMDAAVQYFMMALKKKLKLEGEAKKQKTVEMLADGEAPKPKPHKLPSNEQLRANRNQLKGKVDGLMRFADENAAGVLCREDGEVLQDNELYPTEEVACEEFDDELDALAAMTRAVEAYKKQTSVGKAKEAFEKSKAMYCNPETIDLHLLHVRDRGKIFQLNCLGCGKQSIGFAKRHWVTAQGPRLFFGPTAEHESLTKSRGGGPGCHIIVNAKESRCFCGWWKDKKCYANSSHTIEADDTRMWSCANVHAARRLIDENEEIVCECVVPIKPANNTFRPEQTFGEKAGRKAN
eukprot:g17346.t1